MGGRNDFKKNRDGTVCSIEMDVAGGTEAGIWDGEAVPAASCAGSMVCIISVRCSVRQMVRKATDGNNQNEKIS